MGLIHEMGYPKLATCRICQRRVVPDMKFSLTKMGLLTYILCCGWFVRLLIHTYVHFIDDFALVVAKRNCLETNVPDAKRQLLVENFMYRTTRHS